MAGPITGARARDGADKLAAIGAKLKAEGNGAMRRKVAATLRAEAKPAARKTADVARSRLPKEGGLNDLVANRHVTISTLMGPRTAGVSLRKRKDAASYQTNRGYIMHKTYGHKPWIKQELPRAAGWWTDTLREEEPKLTAALYGVIQRTAREIGA